MELIVEVMETDVPVSITEDIVSIGLSDSVIDVSLDGSVVCIPAGANWIDELNDVDTTSTPPTDGQVLIWNTFLSQWVPGTVDVGSTAVYEVYNYDGVSLSLNDLVYLSPITSHFVLKADNNNTVNPVIGMVTGMNSSTTVQVTHLGYIDISESLISGEKVFIGDNGALTNTIPETNYIQCLGIAVSNSRVYLNPELRRVKRL